MLILCILLARDTTSAVHLADRLAFLVPAPQELTTLPSGVDDDELTHTLSSPRMAQIIDDDLGQLQSVGIRDGQQLFVYTVGASVGDTGVDMRRTMSSTLRQRVSRSFSIPAPQPESE
jgi:hypothetical protein